MSRSSGGRRAAAVLLLLAASILVSLWVLAPTFHWALRIDLLEYLLPSLLRPSTGMLSLTAALFLTFGGSFLLVGSRTARPGGETRGEAVALAEEPSHDATGPALRIPIGTIGALSTTARQEAARALEIGWDDAWATDDELWQRAYETGMREALEVLRGGSGAATRG